MLREKLRAYWRTRHIFLAVAGAAAVMTVVLALAWPPTYMSSSTILIEQQEIPQELVRSAITSFADQRVQVISQRVMTTQNLLTLMDRYDLYPDIRQKKPREVLLQTMRDDIVMRMISADVIDPRSGRPTQATIAFSVAYKSRSPDLALKVANELTSLYLNENLNSRAQLAEQTSAFFSEEAQRQQARIAEFDKALAEFKEKNREQLPELSQLNLQVSDRTELEVRDAENRIAALDSQRVLLEAQLAQINPTAQVFSDTGQRVMSAADRLKALKSDLAGYKARYAPGHPDIVNAEREIAGLESQVTADNGAGDVLRQLADTKAQLAQARQRYSADHPDVVRLQRQVDALEKSAAEPEAATRRVAQVNADNPIYIQLKGQIDSLEVERESVVRKRDELHAKLDDYERRMAQAPEVERKYRELARDLESAQQKYQEILAKETEARVSQNLETERKGERFTLIEPPLPPEKPISPNRTVILAAGLMFSLLLGFGAAAGKESFDASVRGPADIRRMLAVPPLAAIPVIVTGGERLQRVRRLRQTLVGAALAVIILLLFVHLLIRPLDVVWAGLLRRLGV